MYMGEWMLSRLLSRNSFKTPDPLLANALTNEDNRVIGQGPKLDDVSETVCDLPSYLLVLICYLFLMDQIKFDNFTCRCVNTQNYSWVYKIQCMIIRESQVLMKRTVFLKILLGELFYYVERDKLGYKLKIAKKVCTPNGLKLKEKLNYKVNNKQIKYYLCY